MANMPCYIPYMGLSITVYVHAHKTEGRKKTRQEKILIFQKKKYPCATNIYRIL